MKRLLSVHLCFSASAHSSSLPCFRLGLSTSAALRRPRRVCALRFLLVFAALGRPEPALVRASLSRHTYGQRMPLAALTPLAIISGCLTVAGVGMHLNHWLFTGEVCGAPAGAGARAASAPRRPPRRTHLLSPPHAAPHSPLRPRVAHSSGTGPTRTAGRRASGRGTASSKRATLSSDPRPPATSLCTLTLHTQQ